MKPVGDYARADFAVMKLAQELNAQIMDYVQDAYFAEEELNLGNLTYARFMKEYEKAKDGDDLAKSELNRQLGAILAPLIEQVMAAPPQEGGQ